MTNITAFIKTLLNKENPAFRGMKFGDMLETAITELNGKVSVAVIDGANDTTLDISEVAPVITSVVAVLAITKATGAAATKLLQAATTDYTFADGVFTCVGDKSALTLIIIYK